MAPEILAQMDADEIVDLVRQIREYQTRKKLTTEALVRQFPALGTSKTWGLISGGRLLDPDAQLDSEKWLIQYRTVVAVIRSMAGDREPEQMYTKMSAVNRVRTVFLPAMVERDNARFILILGDTGSGKTSIRKSLQEMYGSRVVGMDVTQVMGDNVMAFLQAALNAFGIRDMSRSAMGRFDALVARLCETRVALYIDEGHHMGPKVLNTIKALINQTPGEFLVASMKTLWRRLELVAYEEARQLTGNRLAAVIALDDCNPGDVQILLENRLPELRPHIEPMIRVLLQMAVNRGNLAFVREVVKKTRELAGKEAPTIETFHQAVKARSDLRAVKERAA